MKTNFGQIINEALEKQFPPILGELDMNINFTRISRNTFKVAITVNGTTNLANFKIDEGKSINIPVTVKIEK